MRKNLFYQLKPVKTDSYYKFITKFDYMDRKFLTYNDQFNSLKLSKSIILSKFHFSPSKISLLVAGITLEILTQQRILIQNSNQINFSKIFCLKSTLRKSKLLIFLDICLISLFLNKLSSPMLTFDCNQINQKLHIFFPIKFIDKLNSQINIKYSMQVLNYFNQNKTLNFLYIYKKFI